MKKAAPANWYPTQTASQSSKRFIEIEKSSNLSVRIISGREVVLVVLKIAAEVLPLTEIVISLSAFVVPPTMRPPLMSCG
jgi:hypothetical protein